MEKRREHRENFKMYLHLEGEDQHVETQNISANGLAIELKTPFRPSHGEQLQLIGKFKKKKTIFNGMVRWYRRELHRNLLGIHLMNPPAHWTDQFDQGSSKPPVFQLYFGTKRSLKQEYRSHLLQGFLEVSPTPRVPSIDSEVVVELFLPGQSQPEIITGRVQLHIAGGFHVRLTQHEALLKRIESLIK